MQQQNNLRQFHHISEVCMNCDSVIQKQSWEYVAKFQQHIDVICNTCLIKLKQRAIPQAVADRKVEFQERAMLNEIHYINACESFISHKSDEIKERKRKGLRQNVDNRYQEECDALVHKIKKFKF